MTWPPEAEVGGVLELRRLYLHFPVSLRCVKSSNLFPCAIASIMPSFNVHGVFISDLETVEYSYECNFVRNAETEGHLERFDPPSEWSSSVP